MIIQYILLSIAIVLLVVAIVLIFKWYSPDGKEDDENIQLEDIKEMCKQNNIVLMNVFEYQKLLALLSDGDKVQLMADGEKISYEELIKGADKEYSIRETLIDMIDDNRETNKILSDILKHITNVIQQ